MPHREDFVWSRDVDTSSLINPLQDVACSIWQGKLRVTVAGQLDEAVELPDDAFTDQAAASLQGRRLTVVVARRDPNGPAMQEKALFNPDRHPVALDVAMPKELLAKAGKPPSPIGPAGRTPAQASAGAAAGSALFGGGGGGGGGAGGGGAPAYKQPPTNMGSSVVTAMPVEVQPGGALSAPSQGETVAKVPGTSEVARVRTGGGGAGGEGGADALAARLRDVATVREAAPAEGTTVLFGQRAQELEQKFDERALPAGAMAGAPAGDRDAAGTGGGGGGHDGADDEEQRLRATGQRGDKIRTDALTDKVAMEYEERRAASRYATCESAGADEPLSTLKPPGAALCDLCASAPCQCGMMQHSGGAGNKAYELTPQETKRAGKPHLHARHREVTGSNAHAADDYRGHAASGLNKGHVGVGARTADYQGNVPEGAGDWSDPAYAARLQQQQQQQQQHQQQHGRATHTGGAEISLGGPGKRQAGDAAKGGPVAGGHKTTFTTLG